MSIMDMGTAWRAEALAWSYDGEGLFVIAAPPEADLAVSDGALRFHSDTMPLVRSVGSFARRIVEMHPSGEIPPRVLDTGTATIWEAAALPGGSYVAVVSDDASESGWYQSRLVIVKDGCDDTTVYRGEWQIASPVVSPDGLSVAFVEAWASDRGHVAGEIVVVDLHDALNPVVLDGIDVDVVSLAWTSNSRIGYWGWRDRAAAHGSVDLKRPEHATSVDLPSVIAVGLPTGEGSGDIVTLSQSGTAPPTVSVHTTTGQVPSELRVVEAQGKTLDLETRRVSWAAADNLEIRGFLVNVPQGSLSPPPLIVMVHGGPANLWKESLPVGAVALALAGYAVLLPNPRGSVGRGQDFARANLGDPGGRELGDLLSGATMCRERGLVADQPVGVVGGSYGGYLSSCAAVFGANVAACVAMFGHPDLLSARFSSNNPTFYDRLVGGRVAGDQMGLAIERSPVFHAHGRAAPTLLLHGDRDACTPLGQSEEFHRALLDAAVPTELVVYPGEGHGLRTPSVQVDVWQRTIAWFDSHMKAAPS
jgi:dipeptidyl aminopeptidase/acylaminoacyl peptidase